MAEPTVTRTVELGEIEPAGSRHNWARSALAAADGRVFVGTDDGRIAAYDSALDGPLWSLDTGARTVSMAVDDVLLVGERSAGGRVRVIDPATGEGRWAYATTADVGTAARESLFSLPYVVDVAVTDRRLVAAVRRDERDGDTRVCLSVVLGFDRDGAVRWRYACDASPIALATDAAGDRVAIAYNRGGDVDHPGLVVVDADTGRQRTAWTPETDGDRLVGDIAFVGDDLAVASHADKRGYLVDPAGRERWSVDLATERTVGGETVYAYPTHVTAVGERVVFVTGNTFAESSRDPDASHPREHTALGVDAGDGSPVWTHPVGGFSRSTIAVGDRVVVAAAQHFRRRSAATHGVHVVGPDGAAETGSLVGIPTALAAVDDGIVVLEEPVSYHDEPGTHGAYRLHLLAV